MAHKVIVCHASDGVGQAEALMRDNQIRRLPVLDQSEHLVGIFSLNDVAREAQREASVGKRVEVTEDAVAETLAAVCKPRVSRELAAQRERVAEASGPEGGCHPLKWHSSFSQEPISRSRRLLRRPQDHERGAKLCNRIGASKNR